MIVGAFCALLLATSAFAATAPTNAAPTVQQASLFNAGELGMSLGTAYTVNRADPFNQPYDLNINVGAFYFPWRNLGFEVNVPVYQTKGVSVDEVQAGFLFRVPLAKTATFWRSVSPYAGVSGVYNWQTVQNWAYIGKAGVEFRYNSKVGLFFEGQYRNADFQWNNGQTSIVGGLRIIIN